MADMNGSPTPARLEGKLTAIVVCWVLGLGTLVAWNTMLTVGDYYYALFPRYHPARVLTLVYEPFALGTIAILAYKEAKIDTRKRNLAGFTLFFLSTFALLILRLATSGKEESEITLVYASLLLFLAQQMPILKVEWLEISPSCVPSSSNHSLLV
nr:equilibrative nucleotide transporter 3-like [Coffea arabica]